MRALNVAVIPLLAAMLPAMATAQTYPHKPIRFVVPFGVGGPGDTIGA